MDSFKLMVQLFVTILTAMVHVGNCSVGMTTEEIKMAVARAHRADNLQLEKEAPTNKRGSRLSRSGDVYYSRPRYPTSLLFNRNLMKRLFKNSVEQQLLIRSMKNNGRKYGNRYNVSPFYRRQYPVTVDIAIPSVTRKLRLINKLQQAITVRGNVVSGTNRITTPSTLLQVESVGFGAVMVKGLAANKYICMDQSTGNVFATRVKTLECVFVERMELNHYTTYQAWLHRKSKAKWYLAVNGNGRVVNGRKSRMYRKTSQFNRISPKDRTRSYF